MEQNTDEIDLPPRQQPSKTPVGNCDNCGKRIPPEETSYDAQWYRYEDYGEEATATGWVSYCSECKPPGILTGQE